MKRPIKTLSGVARALVAVLTVALWASAASAGGKGSNQVREIKVSQQGGQTVITVVGSARPTFTAFKLSTPKRLVVDLADSQVRGVPSVVEASTKLISGVAVSQYPSGGMSVSRVMVNFRTEAAYRVRARGNDLVITLTGGPARENRRHQDVVSSRDPDRSGPVFPPSRWSFVFDLNELPGIFSSC